MGDEPPAGMSKATAEKWRAVRARCPLASAEHVTAYALNHALHAHASRAAQSVGSPPGSEFVRIMRNCEDERTRLAALLKR